MRARKTFDLLRKYESRNITYIEPDGSWPMVWERASGVHVWDAEGRRCLDLTGAFGVAAAGHANRRVVRAGKEQMGLLLHAMGDVHPHALKAKLARELSRVTFERWTKVSDSTKGRAHSSAAIHGKTIYCNSGFEAVEAALKTALLATGKPGVIAFEGAYHGLGYGALNATHRTYFSAPFRSQLRRFGTFVPFPGVSARRPSLLAVEKAIRAAFKRRPIGAILVEPMQVRGGINIPPSEFLGLLRDLADRQGALLILDEIYTGFGRTGKWFGCEHSAVVPDITCLGKALTGGFPLSACVGRAEMMDAAWPPTSGEAIHTSTFLGHPVGCAMALAEIEEIRSLKLVQRSAAIGHWLLEALKKMAAGRRRISVRGVGLLAGVELKESKGEPATQAALTVMKDMLRRGFVMLPEGEHASVLSFSPPLIISEAQLRSALQALDRSLAQAGF